ncbi:Putative metallophosphoesterase, partial sequence, partial [Candidatus Phytoplasma solani]
VLVTLQPEQIIQKINLSEE